MLDAAAPLYDEAQALGYGDEDVAAVHAVLARRAGVEPDIELDMNPDLSLRAGG